jgi:hypothetical protein
MTKSGVVRLGSHPDDHLLDLYGERPAFLVTDPNVRGVYDTVYVDLDDDHRFDDEKPVTKASPVAYRDMNGDGYTDLSGGLMYFIADGVTPIPGGLDAFGILDTSFGPGELVAWTGEFDPWNGGHGTIVASSVAGQGVINGRAPTFSDLPGGRYPGAVIGGAPHAKLVPMGDVLYNADFTPISMQLGYFLATRRGVDVTNSSFAQWHFDGEGWDAASQEIDVIHQDRRTTSVFLTANSGPGFGTATAPAPSTGIRGGASTQFGGTGWDSIDRTTQIAENDVIPFSGRGFGANGGPGLDLVADGAYSASDIPLNTRLDGRIAWETIGGTSRSGPVLAGATALVYQAWRAANGPVVPPRFYDRAREVLKSSAVDLGYDSTVQGAGALDAARAVETVLTDGPRVSPSDWRPGDYRGANYAMFTNLLAPGASDTQTFSLAGDDGSWTVSDRQLVRTDVETISMTSAHLSKESTQSWNAPDYLVDLRERIAAHADADLMAVRIRFPHDQFDPNGDYVDDQQWWPLIYGWTDINGDGNLWTDADRDGVVDHRNLPTASNIDYFFDLDWSASEIDRGEYVRYSVQFASANQLSTFVRRPSARGVDGFFLGLQHIHRSPALPVTDLEIEISWFENRDWDWVTTSGPTAGTFEAGITVPEDAPAGMYSGAVVLENGDRSIVVPVAVAVPAAVQQDGDGAIDGVVELGGEGVADAQQHLMYNNGSVFGASHWFERLATGDWRFFFLDLATPPDGSVLLSRTTWESAAPYTDIDTLLLGPSRNSFNFVPDAVYGAPYTLDVIGRSPDVRMAPPPRGVWGFHTSTGGAEDLVVAPAQEGLHEIALHQVGWHGDRFDVPFAVSVGTAHTSPSAVELELPEDTTSFDVTFTSGLPLEELVVDGFGMSAPSTTTETATQDDPSDPTTASIKRPITLDHASRLTVTTALDSDDIDVFVVRDNDGDGSFTADEIVAHSATASSNEMVELGLPEDGDYEIWVHGWSVDGAPEFELTIDAVQGHDVDVDAPDGPIEGGEPVTLTVEVSKEMTSGERYVGELLLGPPSAPTGLRVPIVVSRL